MIYVTPPPVIARAAAGTTRQAAHRGVLAAARHPRVHQAMTGLRGPRESPGRHEVIIADSVQDQEGRRARADVRHPVRPARQDRAP